MPEMTDSRIKSAQALLDAAHDFWDECLKAGSNGAVRWLEGTNGELIVFTRGEYRGRLLNNIWTLHDMEQIEFFPERMPNNEDEED